jgi:predicted GNAT family acetyltransferase
MRVVALSSNLEPGFWSYVYEDVPHHYFFILDMARARASTRILLALSSRNRIEGMMLIYENRIVQLRGSVEAARILLAELDIEQAEVQGVKEHRDLILEKFEKPEKIMELILMTLRKGEETLQIKHSVEQLSAADAEDIAALMSHGDPEWWGEVTAERIAARIPQQFWLGIRAYDHLVSVGGATIAEWGSNISTVVTHEAHRNKGYATSVVSALVSRILQETNLVLIHVEKQNAPAVRAYTKISFKSYMDYFVVRAERL